METELGFWVNQLVTGVARASWIFLIGSGLTMIFGVLHVLNFAHGSLFLLGAYLSYAISSLVARHSATGAFWVALLLAPLAIAVFGGGIEVVFLRRVYRRELLYQFLLMFAVVYMMTGGTKLIWGVTNYQVSRPEVLMSMVRAGPIALSAYSLFTIGVAVGAAAVLTYLLLRTRFGMEVRAVAHNAEMAGLLGIDLARVRTLVFVLSSWLAGLAGVISAGQGAFGPGMDAEAVILAFVVVVVGGMGSIGGAVIASLILGIAEAVGVLALPTLSMSIVYVVMAAVLVLRPWGLRGEPLR